LKKFEIARLCHENCVWKTRDVFVVAHQLGRREQQPAGLDKDEGSGRGRHGAGFAERRDTSLLRASHPQIHSHVQQPFCAATPDKSLSFCERATKRFCSVNAGWSTIHNVAAPHGAAVAPWGHHTPSDERKWCCVWQACNASVQ
jgi:hypothetical protein